MTIPAKLALEDGTVFTGRGFGAAGETFGEVVFNTSMTGYQEVLTDPSYKGQIVTMTYPLIGNYGINREDVESASRSVEGFIVRECRRIAEQLPLARSLDCLPAQHDILGLEGIDTRALVRRLRVRGAMTGVLSTSISTTPPWCARRRPAPASSAATWCGKSIPPQGLRLAERLQHVRSLTLPADPRRADASRRRPRLRHEVEHPPLPGDRSGCRVTVLPGTRQADDVLAHTRRRLPSNGPGDPGR